MADSALGRRSSRTKTSSQSRSHISSANSSSSGRSTRAAFTKTGSPQKSTGSASLSSEPLEDNEDLNNLAFRRRSMRGRDDLERDIVPAATTPTAANKTPKIELLDVAPASGDEIVEDDEAVRCVCGLDEYPGPPSYDPEAKYGLKDAAEFERIFGIEITEEIAGNFVQCEVCNSWQHSACVGFTSEEAAPDDVEYFCEQCRKDLHKIYTSVNGQKYSLFLPIHPTSSRAASRATSAAKDNGRSRSPKPESKSKSSRAAAAAALAATSKRRSTMNSRDAAYDDEALRQAIEASKEDTIPEEEEALVAATRRAAKRSREESEDKILESVKRQRTDSKSPSPSGDKPSAVSREASDDESNFRNGTSKKPRNPVRPPREKTERDERREEQERKRAEAASKRKGRAERRRADDSDPSDEVPLSSRGAATRATESAQPPDPPPSSVPPPDTPPATQPPASSHKKKGASQHKKGKGRNQYTRDREQDHDESPARSVPRDTGRNGDEHNSSSHKGSHHDGNTKATGKSKTGMNSRITMTDMKRRANNILEFITRTQVELVNEPLSDSKANSTRSATEDVSMTSASAPAAKSNGDKNPDSDQSKQSTIFKASEPLHQLKEFKEMNCLEMMDALTRDLVKWQQEFAS